MDNKQINLAQLINKLVESNPANSPYIGSKPNPGTSDTGRYIYSVFHTVMSLVAIYLAFRCNKGFEFGPFLIACCCPYLYIIYILATRGTCGIIASESHNV
jgi:hypothetical protein